MKKKLLSLMVALLAITAFAATMSVTMTKRAPVTELTVISEATTWDFSKLTANTSSEYYASEGIKLTDASTPTKNDEFIYANYLTTFFTADASFKADAIAFKGEYPIRKDKYSQNGILHFKTSVAGKIVVSFNDTGSSASATAVKRYLVVNGTQTEYWTSRENKGDTPYEANLNVTSGEIAVPAGDVTITGSSAIQVSKIVFTPDGDTPSTPVDIVYDFAAAATAGENPDNWNFGSPFYGWESETKTYSKRQDYKGYSNYAGTNLPAECHVFRRSDRINGNIADGGLKCPSQKEMAINGLKAGQKVVIEYTGEGQMLYATGYDPANATAEPNTVAIVGDGNKAAISGTTAIPSGTPIHIVSTDNGYFVFRVLKNMVITKITISEETPIDPATVVKPNKVLVADGITTGTVKVSQAQAFAGDEVTVTATPNDGFKLKTITVTGVNTNEAVTVTDGKFTMIADDVTVNATFTDTRVVYDFAAAATAGENPDNWNFGSPFYGWESETKTYSKRQDYKGYSNYAGTNLPAECHVFRRSDRINGNIADGGLKCPSQKEMAINGLTAGSKVVIEYTGEGQMLYATGYDPANATAEPNTVAIVGDGNKAAISGTTAIPSGTPIHIVSTDNGYFVFRVLKNMVITKITISEETPIDPATVVKPNIVTVATGIENGTIKVDKVQAFEGDVVTVTATPSDGFKLGAITVKAADESAIEVSAENTFVMPAQAVTVSATFTDTRVIYDFAAAAAAGENPENLNGGSANGAVFYGWESESKTYSKRQDYKGYQNYAGTNLPAECHVWRRSDRINGNMTAADAEVKGLNCPNQREMAINGLKAGQKVVIEYTGEGEILYATGFDAANPTAEPNTVAVVGDGNKAAVSGTTTIASGAPIHIVSTDNGYFVFRVLKGMVIQKITISDEATPIDPATVVKPNIVTVAAAENGTVKVDKVQAFEGDVVTVTATPADGFALEAITVKAADESAIEVSAENTFVMPAQAVTVSATFTDTRVIYDFAAAAAAGENPENLNGGSANGAVFYGWESESKTYSKRQDYKGYTWAEGSVLPTECHVWRRSDRINGNMTAADAEVKGLKCPSQKEMAINGLKAGQKVVIEYSGEGEILYATGYDPANATAEPNTVAIVGDGNKAAISGTTAIPSGTPIHIVSTDNGYFVFRVLKNMVITKITISDEATPIDPATVVKPNKVTLGTAEGGTIKVSQAQAFEGDKVYATFTPAEGYSSSGIVPTVKNDADEDVTSSITFGEDETGSYLIMPAFNITVSVVFQQQPKFYIIGVNGVWDRTAMTEMTYNKETGKYEYEFAPTATAYFAFADYQQTEEEAAADADWSVFNSTYRYSIGEGDLDATLGETKSLSKVNGTIVLLPGTYKIVVESDFSAVTITGEVAEDTYVVAGSSVALFGAEWDVTAEANKMTLNTTTGLYEITYSNVTLEAGTIEYKIVKNGGSTWIPDGTDNNLTVTIPSAGTYNVTFTFNPETNEITGAATDATGINGITVDGAAGDIFSDGKPVYNLSGQRVFKGYKGIVIKNGKKVVIK